MAVTVTEAYDNGADVLEIHGIDENGEDYTVYGWVSATTNHYPPEAYDKEGNLIDGSKPQPMTTDELTAYCQSLLDAEYPPEAKKIERKRIL